MNPDGGRAPGAPGTQRSVAELLAAYGSEPRRAGPGRSDPEARRRRAAVVDRPGAEAGPPGSDGPPGAADAPEAPEAPAPRAARGRAPASPSPRPPTVPAPPEPPAVAASSVTEAFPAQRWPRAAGHVPTGDDEAETGEVAVSAASRARMMPERPAGGTATLPRERPAGLGRPLPAAAPDDRDDRDDRDRDHHDPHGVDAVDGEFDDGFEDGFDEAEPERMSAREWASFAVQVVLGIVLGAILWTAFSYLWRYLPPAALVLALASTTGLVFAVRALRRSDDLKTTVYAVVVGLLVTVSPAVLVLLLSPTG